MHELRRYNQHEAAPSIGSTGNESSGPQAERNAVSAYQVLKQARVLRDGE